MHRTGNVREDTGSRSRRGRCRTRQAAHDKADRPERSDVVGRGGTRGRERTKRQGDEDGRMEGELADPRRPMYLRLHSFRNGVRFAVAGQ
jgi:hypothetical protein